MGQPSGVNKTPLHDEHVRCGGKMVDFAGWRMPVRYGSEIEEHHAVRRQAGLFDVSHMGEIRVRGAGALDFLQRLTPNNVARLKPGKAHYTGLLTDRATYIDDLLIYKLADADYLLVVNAANREADVAWIESQPHPDCEVIDQSDDYAQLAIQGPLASSILARHTDADLDAIPYYGFVQDQPVGGAPCILSRTGYTGEDGFEIYLAPEDAPGLWRTLLESGEADGLKPAGLGARDTLRLEAGMALYGHEIDDTTTPYHAGLGWVVKLKKKVDFIGRGVLAQQKADGLDRSLIGFEVQGRGIARQGHRILGADGEGLGEVCSGTWSPTLEKAIGTAYVPTELASEGTVLTIEVRKRRLEGVVVPLPFYRRS
ncbi:MAG: glycine cleavage system aminomethyltransferase GcvT [Acidobacteriota bacterium]